MRILIQRDAQSPSITIDLHSVINVYQIRDALKLALELDGFGDQTIAEVFNQMLDAKCKAED